jgi:cation:H+ antiporter
MLGVRESLPCIIVQVVAALVLMTFGAHLFVGYVKGVALGLGMSTLILSMIITPVATELPEKLNSVIWTGQRKDTLALGNITGAMVFQSSFPVVFGILFTPWSLHGAPLVSALLALGSAILLLLCIRWKKAINPFALLAGGVFYGLFIVYICR